MSVAVVFPGQGSQSPGMLAELAAAYPVVTETFAEASEQLGYDIWQLTQTGSAEKLRQTEFTQPVMFVSGVSVWRVWQQQQLPAPQIMAGHSLGEYTALTAGGALEFDKALALVELRGRLMGSAVEPGVGGMAALLGMEDQLVTDLCESITAPDAVVEAVNFNSPGQVVISGHLKALENACEIASTRGARKAMILPVSVPNHSSLMQPAEAPLAEAIDAAGLTMPSIPVVHNVSASHAADLDTLHDFLRRHMVSPVYWTDTIRNMHKQGVNTVVELGPGKVLSGLCKRIERSVAGFAVESPVTLERALNKVGEIG